MKYPLYNMEDQWFEKLVILICQRLLGMGTIAFSTGKDGGRDGKFSGTANGFPSDSDPWSGRFIVQAKHTRVPTASCSDSQFSRVLEDEMPRILELKKSGKLDYYLLFTNRKLSGLQDPKIEDLIGEQVGVPNQVIGLEVLEFWIDQDRKIVQQADLNRLLMPLQFYEQDLRDVVLAFSTAEIPEGEIEKIEDNFRKIPIEEKNRLNDLSEEYFDQVLKKSVDNFSLIAAFLRDPKNSDLLSQFENTVLDLNEQVSIRRSDFAAFDEILSFVYQFVCDNENSDLRKHRSLIRVFLHFMYFTCSIGRTNNGQE